MGFKLGSEKREYKGPDNTPIFRKKMGEGVLGEANNDGSININEKLEPGSKKYNEVVKHEKDHVDRMASGELGYGNDWVKWRGKTYKRKDGKIKYNGKWVKEGDEGLPWEQAAYNA